MQLLRIIWSKNIVKTIRTFSVNTITAYGLLLLVNRRRQGKSNGWNHVRNESTITSFL